MLISFFRAVARYRRPILVVEVILAATYVGVVHRHGGGSRGFPFPIVVALAGLVLGTLATSRYRPAILVLAPAHRAFATPVSPAMFFSVTANLALQAQAASVLWQGDGYGRPGRLGIGYIVLMGALVVASITAAWRELGVRLRPDGVVDRQALGSLFVPWEAFQVGSAVAPGRQQGQLAFAYQRPELVRRRGITFGRRVVGAQNTDRAFLGAVVDHYVRHPEYRPAIGSEAELRRLMPSER